MGGGGPPGPRGIVGGLPVPWLRMAAWNARGLFIGLAGDLALHRRKLKAAHRLFAKYDVLVIMGAHSDKGCLTRLAGELPSHRLFASHLLSAVGGVVVAIGPRLAGRCSSIRAEIAERDRVVAVRCVADAVEWIFVGSHLVPEATIASRRRLLRRIRAFVLADCSGGVFVGGDFNTVVDGDGRLYPATRIHMSGASSRSWGVLSLSCGRRPSLAAACRTGGFAYPRASTGCTHRSMCRLCLACAGAEGLSGRSTSPVHCRIMCQSPRPCRPAAIAATAFRVG